MKGMVERVARAHAQWYLDLQLVMHPDYVEYNWRKYVGLARATIAAMREPTEAMKWAHEMPHCGPEDLAEAWRAMVDEALK